MSAQPPGGLRGFLRSKVGRVVFILFSLGIVFATYAYVSTVLAIPVFLVVGLALPISAGLKRPRFLALAGLVVLVALAPLATVVFSQELLVPPGAASSAGLAPYETGGSVLQNATISPFAGSSGAMFTWNVTLYPKFLEPFLSGTNWSNDTLDLFISTCPGATGPNASYCSSGYSLVIIPHAFPSRTAPRNGTVVTFQDRIGANGIWSWQMELVIQNTTNASNPSRIALVGDPTYDGLEGPIVGGFSTAYVALIPTIYEIDFVYLGIPFYFLLLLYLWFKSREARRKEAIRRAVQAKAAAAGGAPGGPVSPGSAGGPPGAAGAVAPASSERACSSCGAVVYPNETKCWKCGAALGGPAPTGSPLPSATPADAQKPAGPS